MVVNARPMASSEGMIYPVDRVFGALERPGAEAGRAGVDMASGCAGGAYGRTVRDELVDSSRTNRRGDDGLHAAIRSGC